LDEKQMRWYFYWRTEARRGSFLSTDASYLYLHAYEILNLVEKPDPVDAADYLKLLWQTYRNSCKEVTSYFPEWSGDLLTERFGAERAIARWNEFAGEAHYSNRLSSQDRSL
jgi:hypothetical protein